MKVFLFILILTSTLFGHKIYILANDDGKNLHVKSYFTKSSACIDCEVNVYKEQKLLSNEKTDDKGELTLELKEKDIIIEVIASMGHKNKISYSSKNELITEDKNITTQKILLSLAIIVLIFFLLRIFKK